MGGTNGSGVYLTDAYKSGNVTAYDPTSGFGVYDPSSGTTTYPGAGVSGGSNWFGQDGYMQQGAQIAGALGGLAQAYTGWQGLQQAKKAMQFEKDKYNRDLANQGLAYNTALEDRARIAAVGGGLDANATKAKMSGLAAKKMNTSAIG